MKETRHLSKFLSLILRHKPEELGITLDAAGWASTAEIIEKMKQRGMNVDLDAIRDVVRDNNKQRFKLSEDGSRIRANQGHSIPVELGLQPKSPPIPLYHGTAIRFLDSIMEKGLIKGSRQHVHLSADMKTAHMVGKRHGNPVILIVDTQSMQADGIEFFQSENGVWLTDYVDAKYLSKK